MDNINNIMIYNKQVEKDNGVYQSCGYENDHLTANSCKLCFGQHITFICEYLDSY